VAGIVDIPNACTTLGLPVDIFDFDITPEGVLAAAAGEKQAIKRQDMGSCAFESGVSMGKVVEPKDRAKGSRDGDFSFGGGLTYKTTSGSSGGGGATTTAGADAGAGGGGSVEKEVKEEHKGTAVANIMGGA